jgi:hypothetical protein
VRVVPNLVFLESFIRLDVRILIMPPPYGAARVC